MLNTKKNFNERKKKVDITEALSYIMVLIIFTLTITSI